MFTAVERLLPGAAPAGLCALLLAVGLGSAAAQVTTTGHIRAVVTDQDGLPIPGATVVATAEDAATTRVAVTGRQGLAELPALNPSARYTATVELQGFQTIRREGVLVRAGQTASIRLTLRVGNIVTDGVSGTFGANLNTGIPAEYVGAPGLLSSVITKSGTNRFSGSVNYFFQNDGLVAEDRNAADQSFSRFDAAVTGGGPIVANRAWFFGSYRRLERTDAVVALDGVEVIRTVENVQDQFYGRGTWTPSTADTLSFTFLNDPTDISGRRDRDVTNARDRRRVQGGNNYHLNYNRLLGRVLVEASYSKHNGEVSDFAVVPGPRNSIVYREADVRTLEDEQLGGFGLDDVDQRDTEG